MSGFTDVDVPDQTGKTFVITGANVGIGFEVAKVLAARGGRVILACRDRAKALKAIAEVRERVPHADLLFLPYDQADLDSIKRAADQLGKESRIDVLINNAGVMHPPLMRTQQGFELQFGVNHLGAFAFTNLLLPKLSQAPSARVVITGSIAHLAGSINWDDLNAEKTYDKAQCYRDSKLANLLFLHELDRRLRAINSPVVAVGCHPGVATTDLGRHMGLLKLLVPLIKMSGIFNTASAGAWPTLQAATGDICAGGYYGPTLAGGKRGPSAESMRAPLAQNDALALRLWDESVRLTGVSATPTPRS